jgi:hypothetical protein
MVFKSIELVLSTGRSPYRNSCKTDAKFPGHRLAPELPVPELLVSELLVSELQEGPDVVSPSRSAAKG